MSKTGVLIDYYNNRMQRGDMHWSDSVPYITLLHFLHSNPNVWHVWMERGRRGSGGE